MMTTMAIVRIFRTCRSYDRTQRIGVLALLLLPRIHAFITSLTFDPRTMGIISAILFIIILWGWIESGSWKLAFGHLLIILACLFMLVLSIWIFTFLWQKIFWLF